ncbi:MAG: hypothetical protein JWP44_4190 [Mucilaginibacter sp.]|nr:hypothetical protein [Mucilaginibacter sp.]
MMIATRSNTARNAKKVPHNHDLGPMNSWKSTDCPRCQQNVAETGVAIHTCAHAGAFGKRDMTCQRCRQLVEGVNVQTALGRNLAAAARRDADMSRATSGHKCDRAGCGIVCTAFDW